jgi:5-methylcytosine-specific restriction endonuclease McrA
MSRLENNKKYLDYMKSETWQLKRIERLKIDDYQCVLCGCVGDLETHHISYKGLGNEDVYQDLVSVCPRCHVLLHNYYRRTKTPKA